MQLSIHVRIREGDHIFTSPSQNKNIYFVVCLIIICDVPQEKGATYLREFAGNSHNFPTTFPKLSRNFPETFPHLPTTIPTKFPNLTTRNFPDPATRNLHLPIPAREYIRDIRDLKF